MKTSVIWYDKIMKKLLKTIPKRQWLIIINCLLIIAQVSLLWLFTQHKTNIVNQKIGGDIEIASLNKLSTTDQTIIDSYLLNELSSTRITVPSSIRYYGNNQHPATIIGIDSNYPLYGDILALTKLGTIEPIQSILANNKNGVIISQNLNDQTGIYFDTIIKTGVFEGPVIGIVVKNDTEPLPLNPTTPYLYITKNAIKKSHIYPDNYHYISHLYKLNSKNKTKIINQLKNELNIPSNNSTIQQIGPSNSIAINTTIHYPLKDWHQNLQLLLILFLISSITMYWINRTTIHKKTSIIIIFSYYLCRWIKYKHSILQISISVIIFFKHKKT